MNIQIKIWTLVLLIVATSCDHKDDRKQYLNHLQEMGYSFYQEFDFFRLEPANKVRIDKSDNKFPLYAFNKTDDRISVIFIDSVGNPTYRNYFPVSDQFVSTEILKENEVLFFRDVLITSGTKQITYRYVIDQQREYLLTIGIKYKNGNAKLFSLADRKYYDYFLDLAESEIQAKYPSAVEKKQTDE